VPASLLRSGGVLSDADVRAWGLSNAKYIGREDERKEKQKNKPKTKRKAKLETNILKNLIIHSPAPTPPPRGKKAPVDFQSHSIVPGLEINTEPFIMAMPPSVAKLEKGDDKIVKSESTTSLESTDSSMVKGVPVDVDWRKTANGQAYLADLKVPGKLTVGRWYMYCQGQLAFEKGWESKEEYLKDDAAFKLIITSPPTALVQCGYHDVPRVSYAFTWPTDAVHRQSATTGMLEPTNLFRTNLYLATACKINGDCSCGTLPAVVDTGSTLTKIPLDILQQATGSNLLYESTIAGVGNNLIPILQKEALVSLQPGGNMNKFDRLEIASVLGLDHSPSLIGMDILNKHLIMKPPGECILLTTVPK